MEKRISKRGRVNEGRPPLPPEQKLNRRFNFWMYKEHGDALMKIARLEGRPANEILRAWVERLITDYFELEDDDE